MLDVRNSALGIVAGQQSGTTASHQPAEDGNLELMDQSQLPTHLIHPIDLSTGRTSISLQDMVSTSVALKSNIDVQIIQPVSQWPQSLFLPSVPPAGYTTSPPDSVMGPSQMIQVISALQREVLLLRNELNFELWLSRENVKHIGRLYEDRILAKTAETERQGLVSFIQYFPSYYAHPTFLIVQQTSEVQSSGHQS